MTVADMVAIGLLVVLLVGGIGTKMHMNRLLHSIDGTGAVSAPRPARGTLVASFGDTADALPMQDDFSEYDEEE